MSESVQNPLTNYMQYDALEFEPIYPEKTKIGTMMTKRSTWECDPWDEVSKSYFTSSYIHAGLSGIEETFQGPDAAKLLSDCSINNVYNWKTNRCKHLVALTPDGLVANHALFFKDAEDTFRTTAGCSVPYLMALQSGKYNVSYTSQPQFVRTAQKRVP